jgi:hypothetical protein
VNITRFLIVLTGVRLARFGIEAWLAARFGRLAIRWLNSDAMQYTVGGLVVLALAGTAVMLYGLMRQRRFAAG